MALGGRLVLIGLMGGREAPIDLGRVLMKRLRIQGSTLRGRSAAEKGRLLTAMREALWPSFADGLANQRVLDAMGRAARTKRWVRVTRP